MCIPLLTYSNNLSILKTKTMKQQFTTPRTHVLSLVSYTHNLTFFSSKFSRSLFLLLPAILFSQFSFSQAPSINAAAVNDDQIFPSVYFYTAGHVEASIAYDATASSGHLIAFVTDGDGTGYGGFQPEMKAGLTVVDNNGTTNPSYFLAFDGLNYSGGSITAPTVFKNADVALLKYGSNDYRAIITFETDDPVYDSYILELAVSANSTSVVISQPGSLLNGPLFSSGLATSPRIDGDPTANRFAVVSLQGITPTPTFSIYEPSSPSYLPMSLFNNVPSGSTVQFTAMQPDIALGHIAGGGLDPECVISFVDGDPTGSGVAYLMVDYNDYLQNSTNQLSELLASSSTTLYTSMDQYPNYPHICSEEEFTTTNAMRWALEASLVDPAIVAGSGIFPSHMLYLNSDFYYNAPLPAAMFYLDDFSATSIYQEKLGAIDWMNDDGFAAWCNEDASTPHVQQIVGVLEPYTNGYSTWDQIYYNYNILYLTGIDKMQAVSVASDVASGIYVIAELIGGKLIYKVRSIGSTSFKTNDLPLAKNIYPNPCDNILHIYSIAEENISINDIVGKTVFSTKLHEGINAINTSVMHNGNYILKRNNNNSINTLFTVSH